MKKIQIKRLICGALSTMLILLSLVSCSSSKKFGEPLMTLGGEQITVNMYQLWLSRVKGAYGGADEAVWDEKTEDGRTYNEIFTDFVKQNAITFICALHEFSELGLKLPKDRINEIDDVMQTMLEERGDGSKTALNGILSQYGVNYDILREIYIIEEKLNYLGEYLYGANGTEKITETIRNEYYHDNYVRIQQIFLYTANKPVTDDEGNFVYDENGYVKTRDYTEAEIAEQEKKADQIMTSLTAGQSFELLMASQNEDPAASSYPNGYYFTRSSQYVEEVITAAFEMGENEFEMIRSEYGIHIIKRLPLDENGYAVSANQDFFSDFEETLKTEVLTARLSKYEKDIKIDEELLAKYDIKSSSANTVY